MLNCTSRKQVEKVLPEFLRRWPGPRQFFDAPTEEVVDLCRPLGFANRRTLGMKKMTKVYLTTDWQHAKELPGIGAYAAAAWEIFCDGTIPTVEPKDHALVLYYRWLKQRSALDVVVRQEGADRGVVDEERDVRYVPEPRSDAQQLAVSIEGAAA